MAWNFLSIAPRGAESQGLYPVPTGTGVGIKQLSEDTNAITYELYAVGTHRMVEGAFKGVGSVQGAAATLLISDLRIGVVFKDVPQNRSVFAVVAVGQAVANRNKHKGESLVGHALLNQIKSVAARDFAAGLPKKLPTLRLVLSDKTSGTEVPVLVELVFAGKAKATQIGSDLVRRMVDRRMSTPAFASCSSSFDSWREIAQRPFSPPRGEFEEKTLSHFKPVVALDAEWGFDQTQRPGDGSVATRKEFVSKAAQQLEAGNSFVNAGKYREALQCYADSAASSHNSGDVRGELAGVLKLGEVFNRLGGYDEAINCSARAIDLSVEQADRRSEGLARANRGVALKGKQCDAEAQQSLEAAFSLLQPEWPQLASWVRSLA